MNKRHLSALLATFCLMGSAFAADSPLIGVVNFSSCISDSKSGQQEQQNMETVRSQMTTLIQDTEKELREIAGKFEDTEFLDSLSPKAEEELKMKFQTLQEDLGRYQNQFYQVLQHAQYQLIQKMSGAIAKAAETVAQERKLDYVMNKEACFYIRPDLDVTSAVITQMDNNFREVSENAEKAEAAPVTQEVAN